MAALAAQRAEEVRLVARRLVVARVAAPLARHLALLHLVAALLAPAHFRSGSAQLVKLSKDDAPPAYLIGASEARVSGLLAQRAGDAEEAALRLRVVVGGARAPAARLRAPVFRVPVQLAAAVA